MGKAAVKLRLFKSLSASFFGQGVTLLMALVSVPLFLNIWTVEKYGVWLAIFTIPAYIAALDFGVGTVAMNKIVMNRSSLSKSSCIFSSAATILIAISALIVFLSGTSMMIVYCVSSVSPEISISIFILSLYASMAMMSPLIDASIRYEGRYAEAIIFLNIVRLLEWGGSVLVVLIFGDKTNFIDVSAALCVGRAFFTIGYFLFSSASCFGLTPAVGDVSKTEMFSLVKPSLNFMKFPLANLIVMQGVLLLVGAILGPSSIAIFSTYRTISRSVTQVLSAINKAFWSEYSELYSKSNRSSLYKLLSFAIILNVVVGASVWLLLISFGEKILMTWTAGEVIFISDTFYMAIASVLLTAGWQAGWVFIMAINKHETIARKYLLSALATILLCYVGVELYGLFGGFLALALFEFVLLALVFNEVNRIRREGDVNQAV